MSTINSSEPQGERDVPGGISRRDLIKTGAALLPGILLSGLAPAGAAAADGSLDRLQGRRTAADVAVILLFMAGGPSHLDTFDPKPAADVAIRGPFGAIASRVDGIFLCEHLPRLARQMQRMAILRGVSHGNGAHARAQHYLQTGYLPLPTLEFPSYGAMIAHAYGHSSDLPPYVLLGPETEGAGAGFLGKRFKPYRSTGADADAGTMRQSLDLDLEPERLRDAYGRSDFGQSCLLARRLVERGARFVTVTMEGWDTHSDHFPRLQNRLLPQLDRGFAALLQDLADRGLLASTLVVWMGEFGRTPQINANARPGRDHWPNAMSVVMAGGGIRGGQVVGDTDERGMASASHPICVEDIAATLYYAAGLNPDTKYHTPAGSPVKLGAGGSVIQELF